MNETFRKQAVPTDGKKTPISRRIFAGLGLCALLFLTAAPELQAKGRKPPDGDPFAEEGNGAQPETAAEPQVERRDMPIEMPAKAQRMERMERAAPDAGEVPQPPTAPAASAQESAPAEQNQRLLPPASSADRVIETVWVWQETRDCLWRLARKHYGDPWKWKKIYLANRGSILDPNVIYPKQRIEIPSAAE